MPSLSPTHGADAIVLESQIMMQKDMESGHLLHYSYAMLEADAIAQKRKVHAFWRSLLELCEAAAHSKT